jgi:hypothetical protein
MSGGNPLCRQRSMTLLEIWYLRLAALTVKTPVSTSSTTCRLNPTSNFRRCLPTYRLLPAGRSYPAVEPISPSSNSQIFSPVNGAQSTLQAWSISLALWGGSQGRLSPPIEPIDEAGLSNFLYQARIDKVLCLGTARLRVRHRIQRGLDPFSLGHRILAQAFT